MRGALLLVAVAGCKFEPGVLPLDGGGSDLPDQAIGPSDDAPDSSMISCMGWALPPSNIDPCMTVVPTGPLDLCSAGRFTLDTGATTGQLASMTFATELHTASNPPVRVVSVTSLKVCAAVTLDIVGTHPVLFLVHGNVDIQGTVNASAWFDTAWHPGAGGEVACSSGTGATGAQSNDGSAGGGGGGFGSDGGTGGRGDVVNGAMRGLAEGMADLSPLRGGCAGGPGGNGDNANTGGRAGRGGGAVQIAAMSNVSVTGFVQANGGPGLGGSGSDAGGGGGGAGGAILIEGSTVTVTGSLCANGGGGGGGASDGGGFNPGSPGTPGGCTLFSAPGGGGGAGGGASGGVGGSVTTAAGTGPNDGAGEGGGGGGGGVGRIRIRGAQTPTVTGPVSPAAM